MKKLLYIIIVLAFTLVSCTKFSDSINRDPNQPDTFSNPKLLTYAILRMDTTTATAYGLLYVQHLSEKVYTDASRYINISFEFSSFYADALMNLNKIIKTVHFNEEEGSANNQKAVARILRAYFFWYITDRWGDVPYKEALLGREKIDPAYDSQKDIYTDLFKELTEAAAQLEDSKTAAAGDVLYYGDISKWKRLAGTLHALMALRLSKVDPAWGKREFAAALSDGIFTSNDDNAISQHLGEAAYQNYWYYVYSVLGRRWYCISKPLVDYMKPLGDPRLKVYAGTTSGGDYVGMPYGVQGNEAQNIPAGSVSFQGTAIRKQDATVYLVTYAQALFARAEAAKLGWITGGDAAALLDYNAAVTASINQWTGSSTGVAAYLARPEVTYNASTAIKQIAYQRWVHLYMNGYEAWAEWRRTGYPELTPAPDNNNIPIPRRQGYPLSEHNVNTKNVETAIAAQPGLHGKDDLTGRVWWDVER